MSLWQRVSHFVASLSVSVRHLRWLASAPWFTWFIILWSEGLGAVDREILLALIGVWAGICAILRASLLRELCLIDSEYLTLWILPLSRNQIFSRALQRIVSGSGWLFLEIAVAYSLLAFHSPSVPLALAGAILCAVLQVAFTIALTLLLISLRLQRDLLFLPCVMAGVFTLILGPTTPLIVRVVTDWNPFSAVNALYVRGFIGPTPAPLEKFLPMLVCFVALPFALLKFRQLHEEGAFRIAPVLKDGRLVMPKELKKAKPADPAASLDSLRNEPSLRPLDWNAHGIIARLAGLILKPEEKGVAECLLIDAGRWRTHFRGVILSFCLFLALSHFAELKTLEVALAPFSVSRQTHLYAFVGFILLSVIAAGFMILKATLLFVPFLALEGTMRSGGQNVRHYSNFRLFPMSFWEPVVVTAKVNFIPFLLLMPIAILFSFAPAVQRFGDTTFRDFSYFPVVVALPYGISVLAAAQSLTPRLEEIFSQWRAVLRSIVGYAIVIVMGGATVFAPKWNVIFSMGFLAFTLGWVCFEGAIYRKGGSR